MTGRIEQLKTYPQAARVVALYLDEFCDRDQDYVNMIANAARKASEEIKVLRELLEDYEYDDDSWSGGFADNH